MKSKLKKKSRIHKTHKAKPPVKPTNKTSFRWVIVVLAFVLALTTYFAYLPATDNEFTNWDDEKYVVENNVIRSLESDNIKAMFTNYYLGNYQPLTVLSYAIDYQFSDTSPKLRPDVFHYTNNILHTLNTLLVFWFFVLLFIKIKIKKKHIPHQFAYGVAFVAALIFGVHTLHVESVAWIAERKDVLYAFFFFASLISYIYYLEKQKTVFIVISLILFLLSLLSKGQAVSLALTIVLIDYLYHRKLLTTKVIVEKIPYFILALIFGILAIMAQKDAGAVTDGTVHTFAHKLAFASYGFTQYWVKLFAPLNLSALYTYPDMVDNAVPTKYWFYLIPVLGILALTVIAVLKWRKLAFGLLFFILNIILVLQFFQVGGAIMADRYSYVPSVGFSFLIGYGLVYLWKQNKQLWFGMLLGAVVYSGFLFHLTTQRVDVWQNSLTLWDDVLSKYTNSSEAWVNRATYKYKVTKDFEGALYDYNKALELQPELIEALAGRGVIKRNMGDLQGAMKDYNRAIELKADDAEVYLNRGVCKASMNDFNGAIEDFNKALEKNPNNAMTYSNIGSVYFKTAQYKKAIENYNMAIELNPVYAEAYSNRGGAFTQLGNYKQAIADFEKAIYYQPQYASAHFNRGMLYQRTGKHQKAIDDFTKAIEFEKRNPQVYFARATSYLAVGKKTEACNDFSTAAQMGLSHATQKVNEVCGSQ